MVPSSLAVAYVLAVVGFVLFIVDPCNGLAPLVSGQQQIVSVRVFVGLRSQFRAGVSSQPICFSNVIGPLPSGLAVDTNCATTCAINESVAISAQANLIFWPCAGICEEFSRSLSASNEPEFARRQSC